jgi:hypothetical protein
VGTWFPCPCLSAEVELTDERERHIAIAMSHPDLLPEHRDRLSESLADPDLFRSSERFTGARMISRRSASLRGGKHVVVVEVSDDVHVSRHWIITAYITRKLTGGKAEWTRS